MKKIALLLAVVILGTAAMAAPAKPAPKPAPANVTIEEVNINVPAKASSTSMAGKFAVGVIIGGISNSIGALGPYATGLPVLKYHFNDDFSVTIGAANATNNGAGTTTLLGKVDYYLASMNDLQSGFGVYYSTTSVGGTSVNLIGATYGISKMIASNVAIGADIIIINSISGGGLSGTGLLPGANVNVSLYL
ncbi:MAG: hypothetical protein PHH14_03160 [Candidatus Margulisbacteria bacterium]|nr:hypothetical protein [Candidatus Margulisiibacteriota bacterium]